MNNSNQALAPSGIDDPVSPVRQILDHIIVLKIIDVYHLRDMPRTQRDKELQQLVDANWIAYLSTEGHLRAGRTGRPPKTYTLTRGGATQARDLGYANAHAYEQTNAINQAHDVCTLDIRLAAEAAGLGVVTERVLDLTEEHTIRPDNTITMSDGRVVMFETEGGAGSSQRPRLVDKAIAWNAAASALRKIRVDLRVRVLINQKPGRELEETFEMWTQALAIAQSSVGKPLAVQFWGRSLPEFLESPNWDTLDDFVRLDDPARAADFGLSPAQEKAFDAPFQATDLLPSVLRRQPVAYEQDRVRLRAHARYFARRLLPEIPSFSSDFFDLVREIHAVAFSNPNESKHAADFLSIPIVALMMLRVYIQHYADLHQALFQAWRRLRRASGITKSVYEADHLVRVFLDFHSLRHDHPACQVRIIPPDFQGHERSGLSVQVNLNLPSATTETSPGEWRKFGRETATALAWVLQQLVDYPEVLGIDHFSNNKSNQRRKK